MFTDRKNYYNQSSNCYPFRSSSQDKYLRRKKFSPEGSGSYRRRSDRNRSRLRSRSRSRSGSRYRNSREYFNDRRKNSRSLSRKKSRSKDRETKKIKDDKLKDVKNLKQRFNKEGEEDDDDVISKVKGRSSKESKSTKLKNYEGKSPLDTLFGEMINDKNMKSEKSTTIPGCLLLLSSIEF